MWIGQAGIAVAGPHVLNPAEIGRDGRFAVGTDRVDRMPNRAPLARRDVQDVADKMISVAIIPQHLGR